MRDIINYSLLAHNTFGIDACCSRFMEFSTVDELQTIARDLSGSSMPLLILGSGSNLLLTKDFAGVVLHSAIKGREILEPSCKDNVLLRCGSGEVWDDIVAFCVENGWYGAENLSLIPGEVGASAVQNIGAYGVEAKDIIYKIEAVELATGRVVEFDNSECGYSYRNSKFKHEWKNKFFITHVTYKLSLSFVPDLDYGNIRASLLSKGINCPTASQLRETIIGIRRAKLPDPAVLGNAGSFFMNPVVPMETYRRLSALYPDMPHYDLPDGRVKIPAGWMIEKCGWKGRSLGHAGVHDRQALVLVNLGGATGSEVVALCQRIMSDVKEKFDIDIHPEVNVI